MQLKAVIRSLVEKFGITPQAVLQMYCLERLLERIAASERGGCFVVKGGFLIASIIGIENRSTMDIDVTARGFDVNHENVASIFKHVCEIEIEDQLIFSFDRVEDIREGDDYPGIRVFLAAQYGKIRTPLTVDITTGDSIVPSEIEYLYKCVFDDKVIHVRAYPLENILAEKLETVVSRGVANTRPRDFYDIFTLYAMKKSDIDFDILKKAVEATSMRKGSLEIMRGYRQILETVRTDPMQNDFWRKYAANNLFAKSIIFSQTIDAAKEMLELTFR